MTFVFGYGRLRPRLADILFDMRPSLGTETTGSDRRHCGAGFHGIQLRAMC